jgi:hypothetical protein
MSRKSWINGEYWAIEMPDKSFGFCRLGTFPYANFIASRARERRIDVRDLDAGEVLFTVAIHESSLRRWSPTGLKTQVPQSDELPTVFMQDARDPRNCTIQEADGRTRAASPEECVGLERAAVWSGVQVEERLWDALNGRPNAQVEKLRVRLPPSS